jgi:glyoxylase-like metal-dependent hydrolase (beta-lactamase superfamily II)
MEGSGQELAPGLHRIEAPLGERFVACYLIVGSDATLLFDTGVDATPAGSIVPYCESAGIDIASIRWVLTSHCDVDHMGGNAAALALLPEADLVAHVADQPLIEDVEAIIEQRYREFRDGHAIDLDEAMMEWCRDSARAAPVDMAIDAPIELDLGDRSVDVLVTPGHSDGSISLWDRASRAALVSDAVLGDSLHFADGRAAFPPTYRRPAPYLASIAHLETLRPELLLTAHEPIMDAAAGARFLALSRSFAEELVATALMTLERDGPQTTWQLIERLAPQVGAWHEGTWMFLANGLVGHLEEAEAEGLVSRDDGTPVVWTLEQRR